jgi:hypothetical protein
MTRQEAMEFIKREDEKFNHTRQHQWRFNIAVWTLIVLGIAFIANNKPMLPLIPLIVLCLLFLIAHWIYTFRIQISLSHCKMIVDDLLKQLNRDNSEDSVITLDFEKATRGRTLTKYGDQWIFFQLLSTSVLLALLLMVAYYNNKNIIMQQIDAEITLKIIGIIALISFAVIASNTLRNVKLGEFGDDNATKRKVAMRLVANIFIFLGLGLILLAGAFKLISDQLFVILFIAGLAALGIKVGTDLIR